MFTTCPDLDASSDGTYSSLSVSPDFSSALLSTSSTWLYIESATHFQSEQDLSEWSSSWNEHNSSFTHLSSWNTDICAVLVGRQFLPNDMMPCLCLGGQVFAYVSFVNFLSLDTFVVKFLTRRVRVSISLVSLSFPLLAAACGFLLASLESFIGPSSLMTPISHRYFSIVIASSQFSKSVGFVARLTNYVMLVGGVDV